MSPYWRSGGLSSGITLTSAGVIPSGAEFQAKRGISLEWRMAPRSLASH